MICPQCKEIKTEYYFKAGNNHGAGTVDKENFVILKCPSCLTVFPRIVPQADYYKKYYRNDYYISRSSIFKILEKIYGKIYEYLNSLLITDLIKDGNILDFGCGISNFLNSLPKKYNKFAFEISSEAKKFIKENYPEVKIFSDISIIKNTKIKFDLITLWHVLEHINNPEKTLAELIPFLDNKGYLIISTPNINSIGFYIGKEKWFHLDVPRHLILYSPFNLKRLLKKNNLKIIEEKGGFLEYPLDLFWSVYNKHKTNIYFLNIFFILIIFPVTIIIKFIVYLFFQEKSEVITYICQKNKKQ